MSPQAIRRTRSLAALLLALAPAILLAQTTGPAGAAKPSSRQSHGTPRGWKLTLPAGDPARGRATFARFECYSCHEVKGHAFPAPGNREAIGPELSAMGPRHAPDYFLEALVNPSATIERGKGYQASDGSSKMPSYNESMTVQELLDLVAFLRSLAPRPGKPVGHPH
jgi:mono/diheme cytochrome c family protein